MSKQSDKYTWSVQIVPLDSAEAVLGSLTEREYDVFATHLVPAANGQHSMVIVARRHTDVTQRILADRQKAADKAAAENPYAQRMCAEADGMYEPDCGDPVKHFNAKDPMPHCPTCRGSVKWRRAPKERIAPASE